MEPGCLGEASVPVFTAGLVSDSAMMLSPMGGLGETILDADANRILMDINGPMPAMLCSIFRRIHAFPSRSRKRSCCCPSRIGERFEASSRCHKQRTFLFLTLIRKPYGKRCMRIAAPPTMK